MMGKIFFILPNTIDHERISSGKNERDFEDWDLVDDRVQALQKRRKKYDQRPIFENLSFEWRLETNGRITWTCRKRTEYVMSDPREYSKLEYAGKRQ